MASSTRGGKRGKVKKKQVTLTPSRTGGFIYQSPSSKKSIRKNRGEDSLSRAIDKAYRNRRRSGEISPEEAGRGMAKANIDRIHDSYFDGPDFEKPREMKNGGKVRGYASGGAAFPDLTGDGKVTRADILKGRGVKGFKYGGKVGGCRGGGAAMAGTKFSGCK